MIRPSAGRRSAGASQPLDGFLATVLSRSSLPPDAYRANALVRRLPALLRRLRVSSIEEARERLERQPELLPEVLDVLLIGVTEFFRDSAVFEALQRDFIPAMIGRRARPRILSAGVSRGHELYSLAILLAEAGYLESCLLLGLDCRAEAIENARAGMFPAEEVQRFEPVWRDRYFENTAKGRVARPWLRQQLRWQVGNILFDVPEGPWDFIFYRNVSIYLEPVYSDAVWSRLCDTLRPGGLLVTGKADQPPASMPLARAAASIYRRLPE